MQHSQSEFVGGGGEGGEDTGTRTEEIFNIVPLENKKGPNSEMLH